MKFLKLLKKCKIEDSKMIPVLNDNLCRFLCNDDLRIPIWKVVYTYKVGKHNIRSYRYIIEKESAWDMIDIIAKNSLKKYHSNQGVTDISIEDIDFLGDLICPLKI